MDERCYSNVAKGKIMTNRERVDVFDYSIKQTNRLLNKDDPLIAG
jgi:hypothetical protein